MYHSGRWRPQVVSAFIGSLDSCSCCYYLIPFHTICCSQSWQHSICWHLSLQCSTILFHHVHLVPFGISLWYQWSVVSSSIIDSLYVIFRHVLVRSRSDDPLCIFQSFILVYLVDLHVLDMQTCFSFSEHGYAHLRWCFFLISFCGLAGWILVKYSSVFGRFPFHVLA